MRHLKKIAQDTDCRVVLIRSKGKHFSAGADLAWMQRTMGLYG